MTDRYERIRKALAMGPTPGPWEAHGPSKSGWINIFNSKPSTPLCYVLPYSDLEYDAELGGERLVKRVDKPPANAAHIAACDPDTIRKLLAERDQLAAALEAAREDAARWRFVAQFMQLDDVGDDQYCLGLIVNYEALEDMVTAQSARLDGERRRLEWADVQGPEDSPKTLPPITLDAAIDAAIDQARGKGGKEAGND